MKEIMTIEKEKEIRKEIRKFGKQYEITLDNVILESLDKKTLSYVRKIFHDYRKKDIDKEILKDIVILSQYSNDTCIGEFLAKKYGITKFLDMLSYLSFPTEEWKKWLEEMA